MSFFSDPSSFVLWIAAILLGLSVHEFSHAAVAKLLGDDTAERHGRLTLNPLAHVDLLGLFMLVIVGFGWGKPVPVDETRLRFGRFGPAIVAGAGPLANLLFAIFIVLLGGALSASGLVGSDNLLFHFFQLLFIINLGLMLFNLIPIPPLDGSKWLLAALPARFWNLRAFLELRGPLLLLALLIIDSFFGGVIFGTIFRFFFGLVARFLS